MPPGALDFTTLAGLYRIFDRLNDDGRDEALRALRLKYGAAPFVAGSDTSKAGAKKIRSARGRLHAMIQSIIEMHGPQTDAELEQRLGMKHQTVSARRRELVLAGRLQPVSRRAGSTLWGHRREDSLLRPDGKGVA